MAEPPLPYDASVHLGLFNDAYHGRFDSIQSVQVNRDLKPEKPSKVSELGDAGAVSRKPPLVGSAVTSAADHTEPRGLCRVGLDTPAISLPGRRTSHRPPQCRWCRGR